MSQMGIIRLWYDVPMAEHKPSLAPELVDFPWESTLPARLVSVVNDLHARGREVVTLDDLARRCSGIAPHHAARALRRCGWLEPLRVRGTWMARSIMPFPHLDSFVELRARLTTHPKTPAVIAGKSVAQVRNWLRRGTAPSIGCPASYKLPRCLSDYRICRWEPRVDLDVMWGLPVWKPETLLAFMVARPSRFQWEDIADWLADACYDLDEELMLGELDGRPRSTWMKAAYLINEGERPDIAEALVEQAPQEDTGPYVLGHREQRQGEFIYPPVWSQKFQVTDYLLPTWWLPRW